MISCQRILVPVHCRVANGEQRLAPDSIEAIDQAMTLADRFSSAVTFTHVFPRREPLGATTDDGDLPAMHAILHDLVAKARSQQLSADSMLLFGRPGEEIVSLATSEGFDLIVLGTRQRPGNRQRLIGSTAAAVAAQSEVPTWIAKHRGDERGGVVAATDLSADCEQVLQTALAIAKAMARDLHIVNACEQAVPATKAGVEQQLQVRRAQLEAQMAAAVGASVVPRFVSHVELGSPEAVIWRIARATGADVVVVGVVSHTASERLLRTDTAEAVLADLPCSLLTVRIR